MDICDEYEYAENSFLIKMSLENCDSLCCFPLEDCNIYIYFTKLKWKIN